MRLLLEWWAEIWPNLAASVISLPPAFIWHHRRIKKHVSNEIAKAVNNGDGSA